MKSSANSPKLKLGDVSPGMYMALRYARHDDDPYILLVQSVTPNEVTYTRIGAAIDGMADVTDFSSGLLYTAATEDEIAEAVTQRIVGAT